VQFSYFDASVSLLAFTTIGSTEFLLLLSGNSSRTGLLLEVSYAADMNVLEKEEEKINKYQPLVQQMKLIHHKWQKSPVHALLSAQ